MVIDTIVQSLLHSVLRSLEEQFIMVAEERSSLGLSLNSIGVCEAMVIG